MNLRKRSFAFFSLLCASLCIAACAVDETIRLREKR